MPEVSWTESAYWYVQNLSELTESCFGTYAYGIFLV